MFQVELVIYLKVLEFRVRVRVTARVGGRSYFLGKSHTKPAPIKELSYATRFVSLE